MQTLSLMLPCRMQKAGDSLPNAFPPCRGMLRAENARLLRLLKMTREQAAAPGPGQAAFFEALPPTQHGGFVAQHQQFGVLRRCRACQRCHLASQAHEYQLDHPYRHKTALLPALDHYSRKRQVSHIQSVSEPTVHPPPGAQARPLYPVTFCVHSLAFSYQVWVR